MPRSRTPHFRKVGGTQSNEFAVPVTVHRKDADTPINFINLAADRANCLDQDNAPARPDMGAPKHAAAP